MIHSDKHMLVERVNGLVAQQRVAADRLTACKIGAFLRIGICTSLSVGGFGEGRKAAAEPWALGGNSSNFFPAIIAHSGHCRTSRLSLYYEHHHLVVFHISLARTAMKTTLIIFSGLPGTGKTTLARLLVLQFRVPLVRLDDLWLFRTCRGSKSGSTASGRPGRVLPIFRPS